MLATARSASIKVIASLSLLQGTPANATVMPKGAYDSEDFWDTRSKLA